MSQPTVKRPYAVEHNIKKLEEGIKVVSQYVSDLEQSVAERNGVIAQMLPYPSLTNLNVVAERDPWNTNQVSPGVARLKMTAWLKECQAVKEQNVPIAEDNQRVYDEATRYLKSIGLPASESVQVKARGRYGYKMDSQTAGWVSSLAKIPRHTGWDAIESKYKEMMESIDRVERDGEKAKAVAVAAKEKEQKEKASTVEFLKLVAKYDLDAESDRRDVLDVILAKNKYLRLADALLDNRNDWNDGCDSASRGLGRFTVETDDDTQIHSAISSRIDNWDGDGRVFRDCTWGYDRLFGIAGEADATLLADYNKIKELIGDL